MKNSKGIVNKIETFGTVDGPGVRVVIFLSGCPLRCKYCHNPEMWDLVGTEYTPEELMKEILKYKNYIIDGGVTFSGGEPLYQHDFLLEMLKLCKKHNIHTALDTSGVGNYNEILEYVDLVILDVKELDSKKYKELTKASINKFHDFFYECIKQNKKMWIRQVIVPGYNDNEESILKLKNFINGYDNIEKTELLPYHTLGIAKYKELNIPYPLNKIKSMDKALLMELEKLI